MSESMETMPSPQEPSPVHISYENWIDPDQSRRQEVTADLKGLINGEYRQTMAEMVKATAIGRVKDLKQAKDYAVVWLGLSHSNPYSRLLHTREMEKMLKEVFGLEG